MPNEINDLQLPEPDFQVPEHHDPSYPFAPVCGPDLRKISPHRRALVRDYIESNRRFRFMDGTLNTEDFGWTTPIRILEKSDVLESKVFKIGYRQKKKDRKISAFYRAPHHITLEGAVRALLTPPKSKNRYYVRDYLRENIMAIRVHQHRAGSWARIEHRVKTEIDRHKPPAVAERVLKCLHNWVCVEKGQSNLFFPATYEELRRGRKAVNKLNLGYLHIYDAGDFYNKHEDEVVAPKQTVVRDIFDSFED